MCKTQAATDQPLTTPGTSLPSGGTAGAGAVGGDPLSSAIQAESAANPKTASVNAPTKFGHLLSFIAPLAAGAAIGGLAGRGHPGGGFGAANEVFSRRRQMDIEQQMRQAQIANYANEAKLREATIALDAARTSHEINRPNFTSVRTTMGQDEHGKPVILKPNPVTGEMEPVEGYAPLDKPEKFTALPTDSGFQKFNTGTGEVDPIMARGTASPAESTTSVPVGPNPVGPGQFGGATASPSAVRSGGVPTGAPGVPLMPVSTRKDTMAHAEKVTSRDAQGNEVDSLIDNTPGSPTFGQVLKKNVAYRADRPDKKADPDAPLQGKEYRRLKTQYLGRLEGEFRQSEQQLQRDLDGIEKGTSTKTQEQAEQENADRKQNLHQRIVGEAQGVGIDLGQVPDYQSKTPEQSQGVPQAAPGSAPQTTAQPAAKVPPAGAVEAWAKKKGISIAESLKQFKAKGYKIQ